MGSYISSERISLFVSFALIVIGLAGSVYASLFSRPILNLAFIELTLVAMITLMFLSFIPGVFPRNLKAGSIYYSGLAKEPYISDEYVYRPKMPTMHITLLVVSVLAFWALQFISLINAVPLYVNLIALGTFALGVGYYLVDMAGKKEGQK
jgi:hypothetical protein